MKFYIIGTKGGEVYAAHADLLDIRGKLSDCKIVTKSEYQKARSEGIPSWGEHETSLKMGR